MDKHLNMKSLLITAASCLALASPAQAEFPTEDMGSQSLALQYGIAFRGQNITTANVPSHETIHSLYLAYAPVPYLSVEAGVGLDRFDVETRKSVGFQGDFGISPLFGFTLSSPYFAYDILRVAGGARFLYLNSEDDRSFRYSGLISNPFLGMLVSPSGFFDFEAGARAHLVDGTMSGPSGPSKAFANPDILRGYLTLTAKSPADGAFLSLDLDVGPSVTSDWSHGPREAQVGVSFGAILGGRTKPPRAKDTTGHFPAYSEMKDKQDKMAEEIK